MGYLLQHLLVRSAEQHPNKVAVIYRDKKISYKELDENTNKLAKTLIAHGVKRGDRVGIYMNKSISSIISIHGILKAGAVYVPLDPNAPLTRSTYIIQNCGIRCLLTSTTRIGNVAEMFPEKNPLVCIVLTDDQPYGKELMTKTISWSEVMSAEGAIPAENPTIDTDLAYILYTSGSTGVPKGVMISHLNSLTFVNWAYTTFNLNLEDRVSNHAPLHFDLSIFDIFATFKAGATLVIVPEVISAFPGRLAEWIDVNQITVWYSVPSILSMMVLQGKLDRYKLSKLRTILFAGEVFPVKYLRELMMLIPHAEYYNLYGPTETNVITYFKVERIPPEQIKPVPIGKACNNMEVFALKEDGTYVTEPREEGELLARGSCLAQGYWGDDEKTNQSFIANPTQPYVRERIYKTGDLVTIDENGDYIFLGRRDHMIKSRGYRIELGDIEAALYSHPDIKEGAVVAVPDDVVGNRIKAFVALKCEGIDPTDLQAFLAEKIPKYMVPEIIEFRESLPKLSTGKIDKKMLSRND